MPNAKINFDTLCLGMLYKMREGLKLKDCDVLPKDEFLNTNLPRLGDVESGFGFQRRRITKGFLCGCF